MKIKRRSFLAASGSLFGLLGVDLRPSKARAAEAVVTHGTMTRTICPFCAVGCGAILISAEGKLAHVEGDPDHPINGGSLCAKASALVQVADNPRRLATVKYRAPGAAEWEEKDWDWALRRIAGRVKETRDASFTTADPQGRTVNRTEAIACLGGAAMNNEECYALAKVARALGIVYLEHQARVCHASTVAALGASFGRGAMTNHWTDLANADCVMIIGSNAAENHPVAMKWVEKAQQRGAKLISVDPRFTRTSAVADLYAPLRAGTDVALVGCLIHEALERGLVHREYLVAHTNAGFLVDPDFEFDAGRFGPIEDGRYTQEHWGFQRDDAGRVRTDPSLEHPHCVFQVLKRHFARYTPETVSRVCGTPVEKLREVAETFLSTGRPARSGTILYAMGATQHSHGTQNIRSYAVLQLLLGNIGVAGGGVNALRGESNVQGSTDHGLLFDLLPGYLKSPSADQATLAEHVAASTPTTADPQSANWWGNYSKYAVSLLKAWWGPHATRANEFAYDYLPKHDGDCSQVALFEAMHRGEVRGLVVFGQNPAVSGPHAGRGRRSLEKLDWLVAVDLWETETATFWKRPGTEPEDVQTEVFLLPAAASMEKEGSVTNSGRWAQWRRAGIDPPGSARSDLWILDRLVKELKGLYSDGGVFPDPIVHLTWDYGDGDAPDPQLVAREINGRFLADVALEEIGKRFERGEQVPSFALLRDDGTTAAGNWLYCGSWPTAGNLMARRRLSVPASDPLGLHPLWAWSWPANRRVLYNRAGCDPMGRPWDAAKAVVRYDWERRRWTGDVPDGPWPPPRTPDGSPHPDGKHAFIMLAEGRGCLYTHSVADGPLPEHYEPLESPVANLLSPQRANPLARVWQADGLAVPSAGDPGTAAEWTREYPIVATTCRVTEHWLSGAMSRNLPWLVELVPNAFVEISRQLAEQKGVANGDRVAIRSARGQISMYALVTGRLRPLEVDGRRVEQVAIVWHFGYAGLATGESANVLTPLVGDAAAMIPEYKAFLCDLEKEPDGRTR
jgi:formate dehydrogenase major subunit